jgi:nucleoside-diphosphate-sugar epimerase
MARKRAADIMLQAIKDKTLRGVIGRSADFYGPGAVNSILYITMLKNMLAGKNNQWLGSTTVKHTYGYTEDNGRALVALALDDNCYGAVWHLPVGEPISPAQVLDYFNQALNTNQKLAVIPRPIAELLALFIKPLKETKEMRYQFDNDYVMDDGKFRKHFPNFKSTPYSKGVANMIKSFKEL